MTEAQVARVLADPNVAMKAYAGDAHPRVALVVVGDFDMSADVDVDVDVAGRDALT